LQANDAICFNFINEKEKLCHIRLLNCICWPYIVLQSKKFTIWCWAPKNEKVKIKLWLKSDSCVWNVLRVSAHINWKLTTLVRFERYRNFYLFIYLYFHSWSHGKAINQQESCDLFFKICGFFRDFYYFVTNKSKKKKNYVRD
jgi:hypothetical protein